MAGVEVIDISLHGGPPWGLRLFGGNGEPLMLSKIRKQSEASEAGLQEGDVIIAINGYSCETMTHSAAMQLIDSAGDTLNFMIVRGGCSADDIRRTLQSMSGSLKTLANSSRRSSDHAPLMTSSSVPMTSSGVGGYNGVHGGISSSQIGGLAEPGLSYLPAPTGPRPASGWTPKVKAPAGVTVTEHQDKSFTLGLGFSLSDNKENTTPAKPTFKPDVSQAVWKPSVTPIAPPIKLPINDDFDTTFQHDVIAEDSSIFKPSNLLLSRIAGDGGGSGNESGAESPGYAQRKKKVFADSAFYNDASANYPTIDEQIKMAHLVAQQLMAPANKRARGHQMFMKRRQKSERWVAGALSGGSDEDDGDDKYYQADPWKHGGGGAWQPTGQGLSAGGLDGGLPAHIWSAHVVPEGSKETKAMSAEEIERMRLYSQKNEHTGVSPQVCFNIANDLKNMKGRGGKIFAKRQARSDQWIHDGGDSEDGGQGQGPAPPTSTRPNKDFMAKLEGTLANRKPPGEEGARDKGPAPATAPRNRLKEMIDPPKAKMTPWDAWAEYGSLEPAFEHLPTYFKQRDALAAEDDHPAPSTPASGGTGGGFSQAASAGFSTSSAAESPATAPFKPVHFAPSSASTAPTGNSSTGFSSSSGSAPTPAAKPAGFRPVRFNPGSGDAGGVSSLQAAPAAVDVGFCDL